jgi:hypothetical protein
VNRDEIRQAVRESHDSNIEPIATPEWPAVDGKIFVRSLSIAGREAYLKDLKKSSPPMVDGKAIIDSEVTVVKLAAAAMCTEQGEPLFTQEDVEWLQEKNYAAMQRVVDAAARLNGFGGKTKAERKNDSPSPAAVMH